jgi:hypothetical protein
VKCVPVIMCHDGVDCGENKICHEELNEINVPTAYCVCDTGYTDGTDINDQDCRFKICTV